MLDLDCTALHIAVREFHVIQGPITRGARDLLSYCKSTRIESGANYITAAHAFVIGLQAPLVACN